MVRKQGGKGGRRFSHTGNTMRRAASDFPSRNTLRGKCWSALTPEQVKAAHGEKYGRKNKVEDKKAPRHAPLRKPKRLAENSHKMQEKETSKTIYDEALSPNSPKLSFNKQRRWEQLQDPQTVEAVLAMSCGGRNEFYRKTLMSPEICSRHHREGWRSDFKMKCYRQEKEYERKRRGDGPTRIEIEHHAPEIFLSQDDLAARESCATRNSKSKQDASFGRSGTCKPLTQSLLASTLRIINDNPRRISPVLQQALGTSACTQLEELAIAGRNGKQKRPERLSNSVNEESPPCALFPEVGNDFVKRCRNLHQAVFGQRSRNLTISKKTTHATEPQELRWLMEGDTDYDFDLVPQAFPSAAGGSRSIIALKEGHESAQSLQDYIINFVTCASGGGLTRVGALSVLNSNSWDPAASARYASKYCRAVRGSEGKLQKHDKADEQGVEHSMIYAPGCNDSGLKFPGSRECPLCLRDNFETGMGVEVPGCGHWFCTPCLAEYAKHHVMPARLKSQPILLRCPISPGCRYALDPVFNRALAKERGVGFPHTLKEVATHMDSIAEELLDRASNPSTLLETTNFPAKCCPACHSLLLASAPVHDGHMPLPTTVPAMVHCRCGQLVCLGCGELGHFPATCEEMRRSRALAELKDASNIKQCPRCGHGIFKDGGCSHMTCRCGHHFCWDCLMPTSFHNYERCIAIQREYEISTRNPYLTSPGCFGLIFQQGPHIVRRQHQFAEQLSRQICERHKELASSPFISVLCSALKGTSVVFGLHCHQFNSLLRQHLSKPGKWTTLQRLTTIIEGLLDLAVMVYGDSNPAAHSEQLCALLESILAAAGKVSDELRLAEVNGRAEQDN